MSKIGQFWGYYWFLSNFYVVEDMVVLDGVSYRSVEHAYQAAKTLDAEERNEIRLAAKPGTAKKLGRSVSLRPDWEDVKMDIMRELLHQKFSNEERRERLKATTPHELVEQNSWHDNFWGRCSCIDCMWRPRYNNLGKLLMEIRDGT